MDSIDEREPPEVITSDTNNATKVKPEDAPPGKKEKFRRLSAYNRGTWNGPKRENTEVIRNQDNLHRYDSIASKLPLTDYQQKRGRNLVSEINFKKMGLSIDLVLFSICVFVANEDAESSVYWPSERTKSNDPRFNRMASELSLGQREQLKTVQKLMSKFGNG